MTEGRPMLIQKLLRTSFMKRSLKLPVVESELKLLIIAYLTARKYSQLANAAPLSDDESAFSEQAINLQLSRYQIPVTRRKLKLQEPLLQKTNLLSRDSSGKKMFRCIDITKALE